MTKDLNHFKVLEFHSTLKCPFFQKDALFEFKAPIEA